MARTLNLPAGFAQCTVTFIGAAVPTGASIVFGVENSTSLAASAVASNVKDSLHSTGSLFATPNNWVQAIKVDHVLAKLGPLATGPAAQIGDGTSYGSVNLDGVVPNSAVLITKNTALGGRRGKGRMFVPGISESAVDNGGALASGVQSSINTAAQNWLTALVALNLPMVLLHDYDPGLGESPVAPTPVDSLTVAGQLATQRNRLRR